MHHFCEVINKLLSDMFPMTKEKELFASFYVYSKEIRCILRFCPFCGENIG